MTQEYRPLPIPFAEPDNPNVTTRLVPAAHAEAGFASARMGAHKDGVQFCGVRGLLRRQLELALHSARTMSGKSRCHYRTHWELARASHTLGLCSAGTQESGGSAGGWGGR